MSVMFHAVRAPDENARVFAYRILAYYISEMLFLPGEQFTESEIASQLGISRTPVHDAFCQLSREQLLDTAAPRRATVPPLYPERIRHQLWMGETTAIALLDALYQKRLPAEKLAELENCLAAESLALKNGSAIELAQLVRRYFQTLYTLCGYQSVYFALRRCGSDLYRMMHLLEDVRIWQYIYEQQTRLVQALRQHNHEKAVHALTSMADTVSPVMEHLRTRRSACFA